MGRIPMEHGLPPYVSKHSDTGLYRYFRRPPKRTAGTPFIRSFGTKDKRLVLQKYAAVHAEAEAYMERLISGRRLPDDEILRMIATRENAKSLFALPPGELYSRSDWDRFIDQSGTDEMRALAGPDREFLVEHLFYLYAFTEAANAELTRQQYEKRNELLTRLSRSVGEPVRDPGSGLTMMRAYDEVWVPAATRPVNTLREVRKYVVDFIVLNGDHEIERLTREHWANWRADCLTKHGPGATAFKRFSMLKTIVNESIKAGLVERRNHAGQDVVMRKPPRSDLRNEGWNADELDTMFSADVFRDPRADPADYWIHVICALTGARVSEVADMKRVDVSERWGMWTFFLAREQGKTKESRRIIPIPETITSLGWLDYLGTVPKDGPLFPGNNGRSFSTAAGRLRKRIGLKRDGCDIHAFRHHMKTLLADLGCPDRVNNYITGHAAVGEGGRYGKTFQETALRYLNQIDLGVTIPRWTQPRS